MIDDDLSRELKMAGGGTVALSGLVREDLDPYSVEDLEARISSLEGEIVRVREAIVRKKNRLSDASALFSFKGS
jgi:uncharacterized small protein (DUF1192 family)